MIAMQTVEVPYIFEIVDAAEPKCAPPDATDGPEARPTKIFERCRTYSF